MKYEPKQEDYNKYVNQVTPKSNSVKNCIWAFLAGGGICLVGQIIKHILMANNMSEDDAYGYVSIILVLASVVLTGLNLYKGFAKSDILIPEKNRITPIRNNTGSNPVILTTYNTF